MFIPGAVENHGVNYLFLIDHSSPSRLDLGRNTRRPFQLPRDRKASTTGSQQWRWRESNRFERREGLQMRGRSSGERLHGPGMAGETQPTWFLTSCQLLAPVFWEDQLICFLCVLGFPGVLQINLPSFFKKQNRKARAK